jgi:predicted transposase YdaD
MFMPEKKHLRGVSEKEQRMYEEIKESAEEEGRYEGREEEVAARTVMKRHKEEGHKKGE